MKKGIVIITLGLSTLILFSSLRVSLTYAYYTLDPVGFIEALCENKDKPELACNGKCHLMKVSKSQDKDQKTPEAIIDFKELIFYPNPIFEYKVNCNSTINKNTIVAYINCYSFSKLDDFFHPPRR